MDSAADGPGYYPFYREIEMNRPLDSTSNSRNFIALLFKQIGQAMHKTMHLTNTNSVSNIRSMNTWMPEDIETLRKQYGLSRRAFSELLGVTGNYVYLLEKGVKKPSDTLRLLLDCVERQLNENEKGKESTSHGKRNL